MKSTGVGASSLIPKIDEMQNNLEQYDQKSELPDAKNDNHNTKVPIHDEAEVDKPRAGKTVSSEAGPPGLIIDALAKLPEKAMLDETALAEMFHVTPRTIRRMVQRFELPPPIRLAGRSIWLAGKVLAHIEAAAAHMAKDAEVRARKIREIAP